MDFLDELKAIMDIALKPEFDLAINEMIEKSYRADIEKLGPNMACLVKLQWEQIKPNLFLAYCLGAKAQAVPEGFVLFEKAKLMQIIGSAAIIEPITRGNPLMSKYKTELDFILSTVRSVIETQE